MTDRKISYRIERQSFLSRISHVFRFMLKISYRIESWTIMFSLSISSMRRSLIELKAWGGGSRPGGLPGRRRSLIELKASEGFISSYRLYVCSKISYRIESDFVRNVVSLAEPPRRSLIELKDSVNSLRFHSSRSEDLL